MENKMSQVEFEQTVQQWQLYQELIAEASQSRSDAIQLQKAVNIALKETKNAEKATDYSHII
jgi:hypothetical protein